MLWFGPADPWSWSPPAGSCPHSAPSWWPSAIPRLKSTARGLKVHAGPAGGRTAWGTESTNKAKAYIHCHQNSSEQLICILQLHSGWRAELQSEAGWLTGTNKGICQGRSGFSCMQPADRQNASEGKWAQQVADRSQQDSEVVSQSGQ